MLPLCRETQSLGQQILNATVGINGLIKTLARANLRRVFLYTNAKYNYNIYIYIHTNIYQITYTNAIHNYNRNLVPFPMIERGVPLCAD